MVEISAGLPVLRTSASVMPAQPSGGSGIQGISSDSVGHAPLFVIQDVRCDDLEIIPRRVGKRASAVAVSHRPDTGHAGPQLIVHLNIVMGIGSDAGLVEAEIVRIWPPTYRYQHVSADDL